MCWLCGIYFVSLNTRTRSSIACGHKAVGCESTCCRDLSVYGVSHKVISAAGGILLISSFASFARLLIMGLKLESPRHTRPCGPNSASFNNIITAEAKWDVEYYKLVPVTPGSHFHPHMELYWHHFSSALALMGMWCSGRWLGSVITPAPPDNGEKAGRMNAAKKVPGPKTSIEPDSNYNTHCYATMKIPTVKRTTPPTMGWWFTGE